MSNTWQDMVEAVIAAKKAGNEPLAEALVKKLEYLQRVSSQSVFPPAPPAVGNAEDSAPLRGRGMYSLNERLMVRMGWAKTSNLPWRLHIDRAAGKVFVFGIKDGEAFTLVDDDNMFPSDQLVTQLRMLEA